MAWKRGEFERIDMFFRPLAEGFSGALDLRDDGAVLEPAAGERLAVSTDTMVEGVHFLRDTDPVLLARKLLRVNLSDLAAMGAVPLAYFLAISLPPYCDERWLQGFADGLYRDQTTFGLHLAGGDTTGTDGPLVMTITIVGTLKQGTGLHRDRARAGDAVLVSGTIGDGVLGLMVRQGGLTGLSPAERDALAGRYDLPYPRVALGQWLVGEGARAAVDVSDGLAADLGHICRASGLVADIDIDRLPLSHPARAAVAGGYVAPADLVVGGDDYELVCTVPPDRAESLIARAKAETGVGLSRIGMLRAPRADESAAVLVADAAGRPVTLARTGWQHGSG